jgi:predicted pyridoxine 5'-phosphate oxidase superfamily flavin-nucleotide-binding protein
MGRKFAEIAFTDNVKRVQAALGSRRGYEKVERSGEAGDRLGAREAAFIAARDSFYMATVSETGWPYLQHRGGPAGFVEVLDEATIGFADFRGNRQYVSVGNLLGDDRVALFLMDYVNRARLKILGRVKLIGATSKGGGPSDVLARLRVPEYAATVERGFVIHVEAFDWNCPQHITPRYTLAEIETATEPLHRRVAELEALLKQHGMEAT